MHFLQILIGLTFLVWTSYCCNRKPKGATGERSPVDENFKILIDGNPATYIPGQQYNVSLSCSTGIKFISFTLVVETANPDTPLAYDTLGHFELIDVAETKFSLNCENMIENTNTNAKTRIDVAWVAPTNPESGCVLIKAAVLQHRNVWFIDDGFLTKRICPEEIDEMNGQTPPMNPCCACDEAKYEILLERRWTRNTHAKDFPSEAWRTRFSEIIGASHTSDYRFWEYGGRASQGLRELAEHGATQNLEFEIKGNLNSGNIRTIIKAPGIAYRQNVLGTTLANVRVDPQHHVISLVTKIFPSPDWILGVAGLELCLVNCTWIESKVLNLYPWDIGTDAGASYMSPDQPQIPPDVIRRITSTFPSDYRSPFYDDTGAPMKPLATLHIRRRKLYERDCDIQEQIPVECSVHPWNAWSECSTKCGPGTQHRIRAYKDQRLAESFNCQLVLRQLQNCVGEQCGVPDEGSEQRRASAECELGNWSAWSGCSKRCGKGYATRRRDFKNPYAREKCQSSISIELEQLRDCLGNDCGGTIRGNFDSTDGNIEEQYENFNEPDVLPENAFGNRGQMPYGNNQAGGYGERMTNAYQPTGYGGDSSVYGNNNMQNEDTLDAAQNYNPSRPNYNAPGYQGQGEQSGQYVPVENIYGNEKLIGGRQPKLDAPQYTGNLDSEFGKLDYNRPYQQTTERYGQRYTTTHTPFGGNMRATYTPNNRAFADNYDESMHAINYAVVQEYCFEKPVASLEPCRLSKVVISNYWFYDAETRDCKIFTADNCDENKNKFRTLEACEGTCHKPQQQLAGMSEGGDMWSPNAYGNAQGGPGEIMDSNGNWLMQNEHQSQQLNGMSQNEPWAARFGEPQSQTRSQQMRRNYG